MKTTKIKYAAFAALMCLTLSSCGEKVNAVTFKTVQTEGVIAYIAADNGTSATEGEEEITLTAETAEDGSETTSATKRTKHYETTIPETLVGGPLTEETTESTEITTLPPSTEIETAEKPDAVQVMSGGYAEIDDSGLMICDINGHYWALMPCWGTYGLCDSWTVSVNEFKKQLPDVNVYNMVVPTSAEFYVPDGFDNFTSDQWAKIDHIRNGLSGTLNVDAYTALAAHTNEAIYSRTDHHWFPLGAYYAAGEFAKTAGVGFPQLNEYKRVTRGGYVGSMYMYTKSSLIYNDPEQFDLYIPPNNDRISTTYYDGYLGSERKGELITSPDAGGYYCSFLGSDNVVAKIETDIKNGRTLVIFKESYGNAVVPFLTSSFETIYVCDIRYFYKNAVQFCKDVGATDLLFSVCTFTAAGTNGNYLEKILNY